MEVILVLLIFFIPGVGLVLGGISGSNRYANKKTSQQFEPKVFNPFLFIIFGASFFTDFIAVILVQWMMDASRSSESSSGSLIYLVQIALILVIYFTIFFLIARIICFKTNASAEKRLLAKSS